MARLVTLQLPVPWAALGFPHSPRLDSVTLLDGDEPAWSWEESPPPLGIGAAPVAHGVPVAGWSIDHVVVLTDDLAKTTGALADLGVPPGLTMEVAGRPASFFRVGVVLEVVEAPTRGNVIYGIALTAEDSLEVVSLRWRSAGFDVTDPAPAMQPGRRIVTVRGLNAGLAAMSPDRATSQTPSSS